MARKAYGVEQIIVKLREIELLCNQGNTIAEAARQAGSPNKRTIAGGKSMAA